MDSPRSAEIIPFPVRAAEPPIGAPAERLRRALAALDAALDRQRGAVADWRFTLANLRRSVDGLGGSLDTYQHSLDRLGQRLRAPAE